MSCKTFEHWAGLYVESDLGDRESSRLERHMEVCSRCRELVKGLKESQEALKEWGTADLHPEAFVEMRRRVRTAIEAEAEDGASFGGAVVSGAWWRFALAGGLALLLIGLLFVSTEQGPPVEEERTVEETSAPVEESPPKPELGAPEPEVSPRVAKAAPLQTVEKAVGESLRQDIQPKPTDTTQMAMATKVGDESPAEDLVVKLVTDDPDIVIYWLVERNGG